MDSHSTSNQNLQRRKNNDDDPSRN
jgi:hypothetical protein